MKNEVKITIKKRPDKADAIKSWRAVAGTFENVNPFFDTDFIESWLSAIELCPDIVLFEVDEKLLGIVFLGQKKVIRHGISFHIATLNQSGVDKYDQYWVEHNEIFCCPKYTLLFLKHLLITLKSNNVDMLHVSMATEHFKKALDVACYWSIDTDTHIGFSANLSSSKDHAFNKRLSKNTRYQINRSNKKLKELYGDIHVVKGDNKTLALYFDCLSKHHIERWGKNPEGSGFENTFFTDHLKSLLSLHDRSIAEIVAVKAGEHYIGYSINFLLNDTVYFYCSGFDAEKTGKHIKLGYSIHYALMNYYEQKQFTTYDFLGGNYQYKKSLSNVMYNLYSFNIPLSSKKGRLIKLLIILRKAIKRFSTPSPDSPQQ